MHVNSSHTKNTFDNKNGLSSFEFSHYFLNKRLLLLVIIALIAVVLFIFYGLKSGNVYLLKRRSLIVITMLIVAFCSGISTVLFQTISNNRILSPAIMGFESLFILVQSLTLFFWGMKTIVSYSPILKFIIECSIMVILAVALYLWIFNKQGQSLYLVLLIGIICSSFFNSLTMLVQRLLNPDEFAILQARSFATLNTLPDHTLIVLSLLICIVITFIIWRLIYQIDLLTLGREGAVGLGLSYKKLVSIILLITALLVAVSTALVGPLTFLGFLIANLSYQLMRTYRHAYLLPAAVLIGVISLVLGQFILQHLLGLSTVLSVVINFVGGLLFITLLLKRASL